MAIEGGSSVPNERRNRPNRPEGSLSVPQKAGAVFVFSLPVVGLGLPFLDMTVGPQAHMEAKALAEAEADQPLTPPTAVEFDRAITVLTTGGTEDKQRIHDAQDVFRRRLDFLADLEERREIDGV